MTQGKIISFNSSGVTYGLPVDIVGEMVPLKQVEPMPGVPKQVRGGLVIRNELIPVLDLRLMLAQESLLSERKALVETLNQREQEHIAWIDDLIKTAKTGEEFRKTTDPTRCAFGQWYYTFKPQDTVIERLFKQFERPHNTIHKLGVTVLDMLKQKRSDEALALIDRERRTTLDTLLALFREFKTALVQDLREIAIVLRSPDGRTTALAVETIQQIIDLSRTEASSHSIEGQTKLVTEALKVPHGVVYCLDPLGVFATSSQ